MNASETNVSPLITNSIAPFCGSSIKIDWPSIETLKEMLTALNYSQLGRQLGVSDNAIRKHIKRYS